ncbi:hypothetical protein A3K86_16710 [Photobacterium jeanii]|uniref:Protein BatD n=1 Tax=Photobacterium jeanii TaxID=858640 RepID=A0A178K993_9GAMM|nr:BatD family protein [Photobacterium jeanii]OAN13294.1 hypothetical protein A3K86_16710 [Photobacterium jeanii]PST90293.1 hypothetical protein C9I91_06490 [Photobacterium jeanii]
MNKQLMSYLLVGCLTLLGSWGVMPAQAATNSSTENQNAENHQDLVQISAWLDGEGIKDTASDSHKQATESSPSFAINEQIIMVIEVATPRWLTGGTEIGNMEIPNVIVKQRNPLATNYTQRRDGQTWSVQRWELTLYPQASGQYQVPATPVFAQVSAPNGRNVKAKLMTPPLTFQVNLPSAMLSNEEPWVAASALSLSQQWQVSSEDEVLKVGDSITRVVTIEGTDTLSVLLPPLQTRSETNGQANNIHTHTHADTNTSAMTTASKSYHRYAQPNVLKDSQSRGNYQSSRQEEVVYVLQQGGEVSFSALKLQWWNTKTQQLQTLTLEGRTFTVKHTLASWFALYAPVLLSVVVALIVGCFLVRFMVRYYRQKPTPQWWQFSAALGRKDWPVARLLTYRKLRRQSQQLELGQYSSSSSWQVLSQRLQQAKLTRFGFVQLWLKLKKVTQHWQSRTRLLLSIQGIQLPKALPELEVMMNRSYLQKSATKPSIKTNEIKSE